MHMSILMVVVCSYIRTVAIVVFHACIYIYVQIPLPWKQVHKHCTYRFTLDKSASKSQLDKSASKSQLEMHLPAVCGRYLNHIMT